MGTKFAKTLLAAGVAVARPVWGGDVRGLVVDPAGGAVPQARVRLLTSSGAVAQTTAADSQGRFGWLGVRAGAYELDAWAEGFDRARRAIQVGASESAIDLQLELPLGVLSESVTVTPSPGVVQQILETPQPVEVVTRESMLERRSAVLPQLFSQEPGLHVQQTTAHQGAVFVRGLTGQQVITLIDGVRFNNATFRAGPNQYQALIDPSTLERVEVARGPNSVQYGSDAMGGAVNVITARPALADSGWQAGGAIAGVLGSADRSAAGDAQAFLSSPRLGLALAGFGRRLNDLRAGGGRDSHAAVTRFLGLPSANLGSRLEGTGFSGFGGSARLGVKLSRADHLSFYYTRTRQRGGRRYDQLNGGNGNLRAGFDPQSLDFFYGRWERQGWKRLDWLAATASLNRIGDDRQTQGGDPAASVSFDYARTDSRGWQVQGATHLGWRQIMAFGAELFDERVRSRHHRLDPLTGVATGSLRPRFPDGASYRTHSAYLQETVELLPSRWRLNGGLRLSQARFRSPATPGLEAGDLTWHLGSSLFLAPQLSWNVVASRGFRAPNISDLSQIGLTSNGFEVAPAALQPESLVNYETGFKLASRRVTAEAGVFVSGIRNFITKRTLVLPPGVVGQSLGGEPILYQDPAGWVRVAVDPRPVVIRANAAQIRIAGVELAANAKLTSAWALRANFSYLRGADQSTGQPPEMEGGIPPAAGCLSLRYQARSRWWLEAASKLAWRQDRLSALDLADQRIGAARSRSSIAGFFLNGARARGLVADGRLLATGESLAQVQDRVLGADVASVPWFRASSGYALVHLRAGVQLTEWSTLGLLLENLLDKNYRSHGSGIDGAGLGFQIRWAVRR